MRSINLVSKAVISKCSARLTIQIFGKVNVWIQCMYKNFDFIALFYGSDWQRLVYFQSHYSWQGRAWTGFRTWGAQDFSRDHPYITSSMCGGGVVFNIFLHQLSLSSLCSEMWLVNVHCISYIYHPHINNVLMTII